MHDGTATPMALVISLCGVLTVGLSVLTRRAQGTRDAQAKPV
ncbi:Bcr/CflA subfamily drug resistance transporter [Pseudomonas amygdali pv. myricae]|nr:Bcr/CflA subfamily drug resistance transporter [Pseudomonas amygdali pv. myricae]